MSQQYPPQQPGQYPQQPGWAGQPTQPQWQAPPQPPKKRGVGKIVGLGCLGIIAVFVAIIVIAAVASSGGDSKNTSSGTSSTTSATQNSSKSGGSKTGGNAKAGGAKDDNAASTVIFKVWGTAPAGDLGPLDITYGSDSDNLKGKFENGKFTATLPLKKDAMFYQVSAQLQGSGDVQCSVIIGGQTKTGHASGGYNICSAQLNSGLDGSWEG